VRRQAVYGNMTNGSLSRSLESSSVCEHDSSRKIDLRSAGGSVCNEHSRQKDPVRSLEAALYEHVADGRWSLRSAGGSVYADMMSRRSCKDGGQYM
jgi:hypothetical protein